MEQNKNFEDKLEALLQTYPLPKIHEGDKQETIDVLKTYMPIRRERTIVLMKELIWKAFIDLLWHYKRQLCMTILLMFFIYTVLPLTMEKWLFFIFTSPLPILVIGWHFMNEQTEDMVELECTYKYSFQQILFSKIVAMTISSIVIYTCTVFYMILIHHVELSLSIFRIASLGLTPILLFSLTLLFLSVRYRDVLSWTVIILIWIFFVLLSISTSVGTVLLSINYLVYFVINVVLLALLVYRLVRVWRMERLPYEFH